MSEFDIRPVVYADRKYILQSWLLDYQDSPAMDFPGVINDDYFGYEHDNVAQLLTWAMRAGSAYMATEPGRPHLFKGYLIAQPFENLPVVHFLKVKKNSLQSGVATGLVGRFFEDFNYQKGQNLVYTYGTKDMRKKWLREVMEDWSCVYLPWLPEELRRGAE